MSGSDAPWDDLGTDTAQPAVAPPEEPAEVELPEDADPLLRIREEKESEEIKQLRESGRHALNLLAQLIRNFQLYGADNAVFVKPLTDFEQVLRELFGRLGEVRLLVVEGQPYLGELRIRVDTSTTTAVTFLAQWLERHGLGGWSFSPPPSSDALRAFLALVARARFKGDDPVVVQSLVNIMGLYPFGSVLQLSDGSLAVVVAQGASREAFSRPGVRVLAAGGRLRKHETVDLSRIPAGDLGVVDILDPRAMGIDLLDALFDADAPEVV